MSSKICHKIFTIKFILLLSVLFTCSCKKDGGDRHCWIIIDNAGNQISRICNKTENELVDCANNQTCITYQGTGFNPCNYYMDEGEKFCWLINNNFVKDINENQARLYMKCFYPYAGATFQKIDCNYCQNWYKREKYIYKPGNNITYSPVRYEQYCGDTAKTLFQGRQIIRKDDADSLIIIQFSNDSVHW